MTDRPGSQPYGLLNDEDQVRTTDDSDLKRCAPLCEHIARRLAEGAPFFDEDGHDLEEVEEVLETLRRHGAVYAVEPGTVEWWPLIETDELHLPRPSILPPEYVDIDLSDLETPEPTSTMDLLVLPGAFERLR